jgi:hypothetical protein
MSAKLPGAIWSRVKVMIETTTSEIAIRTSLIAI